MGLSIYSIQQLRELSRKVERENDFAPAHSEHVADLALELCRELGIRGVRKDAIIAASLIHDVGKLTVDGSVLVKREKLTDLEWHRIRMHPMISAQLALQSGLSGAVVEIVYYHHVWYNGNGYPDNAFKKGRRISIGARILAVCDAYDCMVSPRAYRERRTPQEGICELERWSVKQFDPTIVELFARIVGGRHAS
ncbi:MAG: HD domain-containing phosphohydrolase [Candidatus Omnitrophota bacterium]